MKSLARHSFKYFSSYPAFGKNTNLCHFYIRYQVHAGSSEDPDRGIHSCTKAVQDSRVMWNTAERFAYCVLMVPLYCKVFRGGTGT